jgi:hypothetical protein
MKKIGDIPYHTKETEVGDVLSDPDYAGGIIIQLTRKESVTLRSLQEAIDDQPWDWQKIGEIGQYIAIDERDESHVFDIIRAFAIQRFHLNEIRQAIEQMESVMMRLEDSDNADSEKS